MIEESGLTTALHEVDFTLTDTDPSYVVVGETASYSFERVARVIRLVVAGARFIATNPDVAEPSEAGLIPATGAVATLISSASRVKPYFVGKPNPLMMRTALNAIDAHSEDSVMIEDNMDTNVIMGIESGLETILVLSGAPDAATSNATPTAPLASWTRSPRSCRRWGSTRIVPSSAWTSTERS